MTSEYQTVRNEFYQTDTHITIVVWLSGVQADELALSVADDHLIFTVVKPDSSKYRIELDLAHPVVGNAVPKIGAKKVEIKVQKRDCIRWAKLEKASEAEQEVAVAPRTTDSTSTATTKTGPPAYPSSKKNAADWDAVERQMKQDEAEDKPQEEAALNAMFQKIYADADDDTKRAMMKSFTESNGTVLSTDWSKIGQKATKTKPPEGMEYHQWQQ